MHESLASNYLGVSPNMKLVHYTTMKSLVDGIVLPEKYGEYDFCIRATHYAFLNDPTELAYGIKVLRQYYKEILSAKNTYFSNTTWDDFSRQMQEAYDKTYVFSLSQQDDYLPMWNAYGGNGQGVEICFKNILSSLTEKTSEGIEYILCKCWYDKKKFLGELRKSSNPYAELRKNLYLLYAPFILKNKAYKEEKEARLIGKFSNHETGFKEKHGLAIPFKKLYFTKNQVEFIKIGPAADQVSVKKSLQRFLEERSLGQIPIKTSKIPYRNI